MTTHLVLKPARLAALIAASCALLTPGTALAQNRFFDWASSGGTWDNGTTMNWGTQTGGPYNTTTFGGYNEGQFEGTGGVVESAGVSANGLFFAADGYTITGGTLTLGSPGGGPAVTVNSGVTATIATTLERAGGGVAMRKEGDGRLRLSGSTAFSSGSYGVTVNRGLLEIAGGSLDLTAGGNLAVGNAAGVTGSMTVSAGILILGGKDFLVGQGGTSHGVFQQTGGTVSFAGGWTGIGNFGTGEVNLSGGLFNSAARNMVVGVRGTSSLTISATADARIAQVQILHSAGVTGTGKNGTLHLNGGSLLTGSIVTGTAGSTSIVNFNGGTLKPAAANANFMAGLSRANVRDGGARIDTNGQDITIGQGLSHSNIGGDAATDGGLTKSGTGQLTLTGESTYTGPTQITGGTLEISGVGSIASPLMDVHAGASLAGGTFGPGQTISGTGSLGGTMTLAGATLAPGGAAAGTMEVTGTLTLGGTLAMLATKSGGSFTGDHLTGSGAVVMGGELALTVSGDALAFGDQIPLFADTLALSGGFGSLALPPLPAGLTWDTTQLAATGMLVVGNKLSAPGFTPGPGGYIGQVAVSIAADSGATIYYTMDGSTPTGGSPNGLSPVTVTVPVGPPTTLKAFARKAGVTDSLVATATYTTLAGARWNVDDDGDWSEAEKWLGNIIPDRAGAPVDFFTIPQSGQATVTLDSSRTVGSLTFGNTQGNDWELAVSNAAILTMTGSATPQIAVNDGITATIKPAIAGNQGLSKTGDGILILAGPNTYGGDTTVTEGTLKLGAANTLPDGDGKGDVILPEAGVLDLGGFSDTINGLKGAGAVDNSGFGAATLTVGSSGGAFIFDGVLGNSGGPLSFTKAGAGALVLTQAQQYTGNTTINGGIFELPAGASIGSAVSGRVLAAAGTLHIAGGSVTSNGAGVFLADGSPATLDFTAGTLTIACPVQWWDAIVGQFAAATWNQSGGDTRLNLGSLFTGNWAQAAGTVLNLSGGAFSINGTAGTPERVLVLGCRASTTLNISGTALATIPTLQFGYGGGVTPAEVTSVTNLDGGTLATSFVTNAGGRTAVFNFNGGLLEVLADAPALMSGLSAANIRNGGARIDTNGHTATIAQPLTHSTIPGDAPTDGGLTKDGDGTLILTGPCDFTGPTSVNAGTLQVNGSLTATATVQVAAGATLAGAGQTYAPVTAPAGAKVSPGNSVATLGLGGLNLGGTYLCQVAAADADRITVNGDLNLPGAKLVVEPLNPAGFASAVILSYSGSLTGWFAEMELPAGYTVTHDSSAREIRLLFEGGDYFSWAAANGITGGPNGDSDNDGIPNLVEYALELDFAASDGVAGSYNPATGTLSFTKRPEAIANGDLTYIIETSPDLAAWTTDTTHGPDNASPTITATLTLDGPRKFARLKVTTSASAP